VEIENAGLSDDDAMSFVSWDEAVSYAESAGKRLPDEIEYEFAATQGGIRRFPWGDDDDDDAKRITEWKFGPAGEPEFDRLKTAPPVMGLFSNVAEWTSTWGNLYPSPKFGRPAIVGLDSTRRIVRGGPDSVIEGTPDVQQAVDGPRARVAIGRRDHKPGIGLRCARSAKPRLRPEDFGRIIP
jgi:formylglycine-generating enzyme required for sulfatase activity